MVNIIEAAVPSLETREPLAGSSNRLRARGPRGIASEVLSSSIEPAQEPGRSPAETSAPLPTREPGRLLVVSSKPSRTQGPEQLPTRSSARLWAQDPGQSPAGSPMPGNYCFFLSMNSIIWTDSASDQPQVRAKCVPSACQSACQTCTFDLRLTFCCSSVDVISLYLTVVNGFLHNDLQTPISD